MHFVFIELKMLKTVQVKNVDPYRIHEFYTFMQSHDKVM